MVDYWRVWLLRKKKLLIPEDPNIILIITRAKFKCYLSVRKLFIRFVLKIVKLRIIERIDYNLTSFDTNKLLIKWNKYGWF